MASVVLLSSTLFANLLLKSSTSSLSHIPHLSLTRKSFHSQAAPTFSTNKVVGSVIRCMASSTVGAESFSTLAMSTNEPVVSVDWLYAHLKEPDLKVLDASWYMPNEQRNPLQEYQVAHIPGALFFDVDGISDRTTNLPHMLPSEEAFAAAISALGIKNKDGVVIYDGKGIFSAARVWWMFRAFGHGRVWVLDGGLPGWRASGYDLESSASGDAILKASAASEAIEKVYQGQMVGPATFQTKFQPHLVWTLDQVWYSCLLSAYNTCWVVMERTFSALSTLRIYSDPTAYNQFLSPYNLELMDGRSRKMIEHERKYRTDNEL